MTADVMAENRDEPPVVEGPGRLLRDAREALGFSQEEVARRLHLELKIVRALEEDDYKNLPPPIFVKGYLRNYAGLVNLSADELLASYERLGGNVPPPIKVRVPYTQGVEHRSDQPVQLATYVMGLAVLVAVLGVWWWQGVDEPHPSVEALPEAVAPLSLDQSGNASQSLLAPVPGATDDAMSAGEETIPSIDVVTPAPATSPSVMSPVVPRAGAEQGKPVPADTAVASAAPAATVASQTIKLIFSADSWVQITDANEQRVFYDLGKEGVTKTLQGVPPFKVMIGYSPGVQVEYNGVPFDHSRFVRGERAKFVLGDPTETTH